MKRLKMCFVLSFLLSLISSNVMAADFDWFRDLNTRARANIQEFRARIGARFKIGNVEIDAVLENYEDPADAYIALRLGEMSGYPIARVTEQYRSHKGKGWGVIAKNLGIKPGSDEFHALKKGYDLYDNQGHGKHGAEGKNKGKSKGKKKK